MKRLLYILLFIPGLCFSQIVINDLPSGGAIGTAANTVNKGSLFHVNQTTSGQTLSVPNPTATNFSKFIYILDIGSASFTLSPGGNLTPGTGVILVWTGTNWNVAGNGSPPVSTVTQSITNGDVSFSPSGDAVFDALALKENAITATTSSDYWAGDKVFRALDKNAVGLGNVDNTSDANKPVSTAQQTALNGKQDAFTSQVANKFYASPNGSSGTPSFRAIVAADVPTLNQNTTGNAATVTTIPTLSGDVSNTGNNVSVSGSVVKSVVLNTPNVVFSTPINFSTSSSTATGTLSLNTQSANTVFTGPSTGSAATPTFRSLVANDIPSLTASKISDLGTAATKNVGTTSGTVAAGDDSRFDNATTPVVFHDDGGYNRNPADAATYYLKTHITQAAVTTSSQGDGVRFKCPRNLTFVAAQINAFFTGGSSEATTFTINNVTAGTSQTITSTANYSLAFSTNHSFSFSCSANDYIEVRMVCPTWATNPTVLNQIVTLYYR